MTRCLDFSDGLQQLTEKIQRHEIDSRGNYSEPIKDLIKFLEILFFLSGPSEININLLVKLYTLTASINVAKEELYKFYRQSVADERLPIRYKSIEQGQTLPQMIQDLAQIRQIASSHHNTLVHPLLTFVKFLSKKMSGPIKDSLLQWREETATKLRITLAEDALLEQESNKNLYYLLVKFKPSDDKKDEFEIQAWLIYEQNKKTTNLYGYSKEEVTLEEMPFLLDELILESERYADMFTIELFLPLTLLNCDKTDVHTWKLYDQYDSYAISHKYPLVLRSYDRIYRMNKKRPEIKLRERKAWENNWAICKKYQEIMLNWTLKEKDARKANLTAWLQSVACLTLTFVPPTFDETQTHIFHKMLSAGISVAIWPRGYCKGLDEDIVEQTYHHLLEGSHFSTLPEMILERRREALMDETSLANYLTLFLDNPYRLPCDAPDTLPEDKNPLAFPQERI
jgi:vWA-MoxR associated protein C-terminal domain